MNVKKILSFFGWPILLGPAILVYIGAGLNHACTAANDGVMPVRSVNCEAIQSDKEDPDYIHVCMTPKTHLKFLSDIFTEDDGIVSVGDDLIGFGQAISTQCITLWGVMAFFCLIRKEKFYWE